MCAIRFTLAVFFVLLWGASAHAVTIDFDELEYIETPIFDHFDDHPVTDEYADMGLIINYGFLAQYYPGSSDILSAPNYLLMGHGSSLVFTDSFPTMVSMYVSSGLGEKIFIEAYDAIGNVHFKATEGYTYLNPTPYTPNQLVTFYSSSGFQRFNFSSFWDGRVNASIDDLTFTYANLPEPISLYLLLTGLVGIFLRHRRQASFKPI